MALPTKHTKLNEIESLDTFYNGGKGSGNFGHSGRPGEVGGSSSSGSGGGSTMSKKTKEKGKSTSKKTTKFDRKEAEKKAKKLMDTKGGWGKLLSDIADRADKLKKEAEGKRVADWDDDAFKFDGTKKVRDILELADDPNWETRAAIVQILRERGMAK